MRNLSICKGHQINRGGNQYILKIDFREGKIKVRKGI